MDAVRYGYDFLEKVCTQLELSDGMYWRHSMSPRGYPAIYIEHGEFVIAPLICFSAGRDGYGPGLTGREYVWAKDSTTVQSRVDQMVVWLNAEAKHFGPRVARLDAISDALFT